MPTTILKIYIWIELGWKFYSCMKHNLDKTIDTKFHKNMLNTNIMYDIEGEMEYVWPLEIRQLGNDFKYSENYIHKWRTNFAQD